MAITLAQAESRLDQYYAAEEAVLNGQSYSIGSRSLTRANIKEIRDGIDYWENKVKSKSSGGRQVIGAEPIG